MSIFELKTVTPAEMGLVPARWNRVLQYASELTATGQLPALSFQVQRGGLTTGVHNFGRRQLDDPADINDRTLFLVASLTKPMLAMAAMTLVERGQLTLNTAVHRFFPAMKEGGKKSLTIKHLITHTSGLPDMLPNNAELRGEHVPMERFVEETLQVDLQFLPGRSVQYQSMGYALLGAILEKVTGLACRDFLKKELFDPLLMTRSRLGIEADSPEISDIAELDLSEPQRIASGWNWNSRYWRELGAPWGGVLATTADVSRFLRAMMVKDDPQQASLFSPSTLDEAVGNRLFDFPSIPDSEKRNRGWGLGWRLNWKDHRNAYSDLLPANIAGHWGATGTLFWLDRDREIGAVLLGTKPLGDSVSSLTNLSNMIVASLTNTF